MGNLHRLKKKPVPYPMRSKAGVSGNFAVERSILGVQLSPILFFLLYKGYK